MTEARKKLDAAILELLDEYEEAVEPEPPARKIDHPAFADWRINTVGRVIDIESWYINGDTNIRWREMQSKLIVVAPDLMRIALLLANAESSCDRQWLHDLIIKARCHIIAGGFECDLDRT